jgi:hypothetical protein
LCAREPRCSIELRLRGDLGLRQLCGSAQTVCGRVATRFDLGGRSSSISHWPLDRAAHRRSAPERPRTPDGVPANPDSEAGSYPRRRRPFHRAPRTIHTINSAYRSRARRAGSLLARACHPGTSGSNARSGNIASRRFRASLRALCTRSLGTTSESVLERPTTRLLTRPQASVRSHPPLASPLIDKRRYLPTMTSAIDGGQKAR